jgi:hypothetical protein
MVFFGLGSLVFRKPSPAQVAPPAQRDSDIIESYFAAPKTPVAPRAPVAMPRQLFANMD